MAGIPVGPDAAVVGAALAAVGALSLSGMAVAIRKGTGDGDGRAADALFVVILTNVVVFLPAAAALEFPGYGLTRTGLLAFGAAGVVGTLLGRAFTYTSIERIGASRTDPIKSSQPLHATLIAVVVLGETVSGLRMAGVLAIVVGIAAISWETTRRREGAVGDVSAVDLLFPLAGAFFYGVEPIFAKVGFAEGTPVLVGLTVKTIAALVGVTGFLLARGTVPVVGSAGGLRGWFVLAGGLNTTFLFAYYLALEVAPVSVVVPIITTSPLAVAVLSYLYLPRLETVTPKLVAGACVVVAGAVTVTLA